MNHILTTVLTALVLSSISSVYTTVIAQIQHIPTAAGVSPVGQAFFKEGTDEKCTIPSGITEFQDMPDMSKFFFMRGNDPQRLIVLFAGTNWRTPGEATGTARVRLVVDGFVDDEDGVVVYGDERFRPNAPAPPQGLSGGYNFITRVLTPNRQHNVKLQWRNSNTAGGTVCVERRSLIVFSR